MVYLQFEPITSKGCGTTKQCYFSPDKCDVGMCDYFISWSDSGDYLDFELTGTKGATDAYLAVGFSDDGQMVNTCDVLYFV